MRAAVSNVKMRKSAETDCKYATKASGVGISILESHFCVEEKVGGVWGLKEESKE